MAFFTEAQLRALAQTDVRKSQGYTTASVLLEKMDAAAGKTGFDIFLSHSIKDADIVLGMVRYLEKHKYTVYVDWLVDTQLDRSKVNTGTAQQLRDRMIACKSLFFLTSPNAMSSLWMPWECGYFDGLKHKVAIVPVFKEAVAGDSYKGQEYLGLYPYTVFGNDTSQRERIWVRPDGSHYLVYEAWVSQPEPVQWSQG